MYGKTNTRCFAFNIDSYIYVCVWLYSFIYLMGHQTWLEYWPTEVEGQSPEYKDAYKGLTDLVFKIKFWMCYKV